MKLIAALFFLTFCTSASAQKIEKYYDYNWKETDVANARFYSFIQPTDSGWFRGDYYINKKKAQMVGLYKDEQCKIPNGTFYYFYENGNLESIDKFIDGKREGICLRYNYNGTIADSGFFKNNIPVGVRLRWYSNGFMSDSSVTNEDGSGVSVSWFDDGKISSAGYLAAGGNARAKWQFFHDNGKLAAIETYDTGKLLDKKYFDDNGNAMTDTTDKTSDPVFPGGDDSWISFLQKHLYFPDQYTIINNTVVAVVITFTIDQNGNVKDAFINVPFNVTFESIALKAISKSPKWKPAIEHNRFVSSTLKQTVNFSQDILLHTDPDPFNY